MSLVVADDRAVSSPTASSPTVSSAPLSSVTEPG
jgi:hypothetical protein